MVFTSKITQGHLAVHALPVPPDLQDELGLECVSSASAPPAAASVPSRVRPEASGCLGLAQVSKVFSLRLSSPRELSSGPAGWGEASSLLSRGN